MAFIGAPPREVLWSVRRAPVGVNGRAAVTDSPTPHQRWWPSKDASDGGHEEANMKFTQMLRCTAKAGASVTLSDDDEAVSDERRSLN